MKNISDFIITDTIININKIVSISGTSFHLFIFAVSSPCQNITISNQLRIANVNFEALNDVSISGGSNFAEIQIALIEPANADQNTIPNILIDNVYTTKNKIGSVDGASCDVIFRFLKLMLSHGYQNVTVSNVNLEVVD